MGVHVHSSTTKAYYFAYPIGLTISFLSYWLFNYISPPVFTVPLSEWREPADYIRPEEREDVIEGRDDDAEMGTAEGDEMGEKGAIRVVGSKSVSS